MQLQSRAKDEDLIGFSFHANLFIEMPDKHYITASLLVLESFLWMS